MDVKISIDGQTITVPADQNLLAACLSAKLNLPYFCWHPALGSVGSCRQCAVKLFASSADTEGRIVMACMTKPTPGMRVSLLDSEAAAFREAVVEMVLTNHPHDCPVCEVGGECHLQDMTVLTGHNTRRHHYPKRTHRNQNLGPFIRHEMNRCIGCYRCVRFYRDYAGGDDFGVFAANRNIFFGRAEDGALENDFAGNLVEVCPTGVFADKPFSAKFRRKWDMRATPSICPHCAVGCNITINEREGEFRRVTNRYNATLNGYFLCDRGRFGTGFITSNTRLRQSRNRAGTVPAAAAQAQLTTILTSGDAIGIGSPRASLEANFALRTLVGPANFFAGLSDFESRSLQTAMHIMQRLRLATLQQAEQADAVLVLGDDPALIAPRLALALRQAARRVPEDILASRDIPAWDDNAARQAAAGSSNPCIVVTPVPSWLDKIATAVFRKSAAGISTFAMDLVRQIESQIPTALATALATALCAAKQPLIVAGGDAATLAAAANIVIALRRTGIAANLTLLAPEANSIGLGLLDCRPLSSILPAIKNQPVIVLERDLMRLPEGAEIFASAKSVCVLDHIQTPSVQRADLAIAVGSFAESDGTVINLEGRVQRFFKAIFGANDPPQSWAILRDAGILSGRLNPAQWPTQEALRAAMSEELPQLPPPAPAPTAKPATLPHRYSGRTAIQAGADMREPLPPSHPNAPLGTTMEGPPIHAQTAIRPVLWSPGWNSSQAAHKFESAPGAAPDDLFLSASTPDSTTYFDVPAPHQADHRSLGTEELSDLSPAIIARRSGTTS